MFDTKLTIIDKEQNPITQGLIQYQCTWPNDCFGMLFYSHSLFVQLLNKLNAFKIDYFIHFQDTISMDQMVLAPDLTKNIAFIYFVEKNN